MRDYVISKSNWCRSAPVGAYLDLTISLRSTVRMNKEAPFGADFLVIMRDIVISKSAPIGADLDLTISLRSTVRINKEAPIGADSFCDSFCDDERYCQIKIGTNWCLFIHSVIRDNLILRSAPIGASSF